MTWCTNRTRYARRAAHGGQRRAGACAAASLPSLSATCGLHPDSQEIQAEIAAIQRQITASVTFLPLNDEPCAFDLLVYTDSDVEVRGLPPRAEQGAGWAALM